MAEGEVLQISTTNDTETSEAAYLDVIRAKTAALFAAACRVGAVIAERPRIEQEALDSYGMNLGVAFQLVDDMLDYAADQKTLGKTVGDDFTEGKVTLPAVLAYRRGDDEQRSFWRRTLGEMEQKEGDLEHAMALMNEHNALSDTIERARHYGAMARDALAIFPDRAEKKAMLGLVDFRRRTRLLKRNRRISFPDLMKRGRSARRTDPSPKALGRVSARQRGTCLRGGHRTTHDFGDRAADMPPTILAFTWAT